MGGGLPPIPVFRGKQQDMQDLFANHRETDFDTNGVPYLAAAGIQRPRPPLLEIKGAKASFGGVPNLCRGLVASFTLKEVRLLGIGATMDVDAAACVGHVLKFNTYLRTLNLAGNPHIGKQGAAAIGEGLAENTTLTSLDMGNCDIGGEGLCSLGEALLRNRESAISELNVRENRVGPEGMVLFSHALPRLGGVKSLDFSANRLADAGIKHLAGALRLTPKLQSLKVERNGISQEGMAILCQSLSLARDLTALDLQRNRMGSAVACLKELLPHVASLTTLDLSHNFISAKEAGLLGRACIGHPKLNRVYFSGNDLGPQGASEIFSAASFMGGLRHLHLESCAIDFTYNPPAQYPNTTNHRPLASGQGQGGTPLLGMLKLLLTSRWRDLETLSLSGNPLGPHAGKELARELVTIGRMARGQLSDPQASPISGARVQLGGQCCALSSLDVSWAHLGPEGASAILWATTSGELPNLKRLHMAGNGIGDAGLVQLCMAAGMEQAALLSGAGLEAEKPPPPPKQPSQLLAKTSVVQRLLLAKQRDQELQGGGQVEVEDEGLKKSEQGPPTTTAGEGWAGPPAEPPAEPTPPLGCLEYLDLSNNGFTVAVELGLCQLLLGSDLLPGLMLKDNPMAAGLAAEDGMLGRGVAERLVGDYNYCSQAYHAGSVVTPQPVLVGGRGRGGRPPPEAGHSPVAEPLPEVASQGLTTLQSWSKSKPVTEREEDWGDVMGLPTPDFRARGVDNNVGRLLVTRRQLRSEFDALCQEIPDPTAAPTSPTSSPPSRVSSPNSSPGARLAPDLPALCEIPKDRFLVWFSGHERFGTRLTEAEIDQIAAGHGGFSPSGGLSFSLFCIFALRLSAA